MSTRRRREQDQLLPCAAGSRTAEWWTPSEDALRCLPRPGKQAGLPRSRCLPCRLPGGGQQSSTLCLQFLVIESYPKYLKNI